MSECARPDCQNEGTTTGTISVGETPLGPVLVCDECAGRLFDDNDPEEVFEPE